MMDTQYSISPAHYNDIPSELLQGKKTILEFGPATGINHLISKHRNFFINNNTDGRYLGVDLMPYEQRYLTIEQGDIRHFRTSQQFDIVIALHVLEHIELVCWPDVLGRLKSWVNPGGHLIIGTPCNEPPHTSELHLVSRITPELVKKFLPDAQVQRIRTKYSFAEDGARFGFALLRYIKRWLTRHPYVRTYGRLIAIWKNETVKEGEEP